MTTESQHIDAVVRVMDDPYVWVGTTDEAGDDLFVDGVIGLDDASKIARTILDSTDPAVHAAMLDALTRHGVLTEEWALRYERSGDPTMDNPSGVTTQTSVVGNRAIAEQAVLNRIPGTNSSIRNRRVERRLVTPWEVDA